MWGTSQFSPNTALACNKLGNAKNLYPVVLVSDAKTARLDVLAFTELERTTMCEENQRRRKIRQSLCHASWCFFFIWHLMAWDGFPMYSSLVILKRFSMRLYLSPTSRVVHRNSLASWKKSLRTDLSCPSNQPLV